MPFPVVLFRPSVAFARRPSARPVGGFSEAPPTDGGAPSTPSTAPYGTTQSGYPKPGRPVTPQEIEDSNNGYNLGRLTGVRAWTDPRPIYMPAWVTTAGPQFRSRYEEGLNDTGCMLVPTDAAPGGFRVERAPWSAPGPWQSGRTPYGASVVEGLVAGPLTIASVGAGRVFGNYGRVPGPQPSKRTADFVNGWKLGREDVRRASGGAVVWVPKWLPAGDYAMGYREGVWSAGGRIDTTVGGYRVTPPGGATGRID